MKKDNMNELTLLLTFFEVSLVLSCVFWVVGFRRFFDYFISQFSFFLLIASFFAGSR